jgi:hypothetical protein
LCWWTPEAPEVEGLKPRMVNCGHLANPDSQNLSGARGAVLPWTLQSLATCRPVMEKKNNKNNPKKKQTNKWAATILGDQEQKISGVMGNWILLGLRKVIVMRQLTVDHPLTVKATNPKIYPKI